LQFDINDLLSVNADSGGIFVNPAGNVVSNTSMTLNIMGIYPFKYIIGSDSCENDTSFIIIQTEDCWLFDLNENTSEESILASPNPIEDVLTINDNHFDNLQVYNSFGQLVFECEALFSKELDLSTIQNGLYLLRIEREKKVYYQRILKE
jgi:hypothetical protein